MQFFRGKLAVIVQILYAGIDKLQGKIVGVSLLLCFGIRGIVIACKAFFNRGFKVEVGLCILIELIFFVGTSSHHAVYKNSELLNLIQVLHFASVDGLILF